jgi:hypothetical protein
MKSFFYCSCFLLSVLPIASGEDFLDRVDQTLTISIFNDQVRARISGLLDLEYYNFPQPPPGLIRAGGGQTYRQPYYPPHYPSYYPPPYTYRTQAGEGHDLFTPRLSLFLDAQIGPNVYFFVQSRIDTGFDPTDLGAQWRADEYALRVKPWTDGRFDLQVGKFSTVVGGWVERHLSWDNPFVNAPLPYETATLVSDREIPLTGQSFRKVPGFDKYEFLPILWGPVYAQGISVAGRIGMFEYAAELKNAVVASRPESWNDFSFDHPAVDLRVGFRPNEAWRFGFSAAEGSYLQPDARLLSYYAPPGAPSTPYQSGNLDDYRQYLLGQDISYARGHLQIWAEAFESRFEVPRLGNADVFAYYIEAKYKITPQLFGALRWNQELFATENDPAGRPVAKAHDIWRVDGAVGYRFTAHSQLKLQYSLAQGDFTSTDLKGTFAAQFTVRF